VENENKINPQFGRYLQMVFSESFKVSLISYFIFSFVDSFQEGIISDWFDINIFLSATLITGAITVIFFDFKPNKDIINHTKKQFIFPWLLAIIGSVIFYLKTKSIGWPALVIAIIAGLFVIILSLVLTKSNSKDN